MNLNDLAADVLQHQRSTPDLIASALRQAILHGIFQEGQSLRQDEIATKFGVSRIPVREALRQLEAEGLVKFYQNRGATVTALSLADVQEIFEIRVALETTAIQLAIPNLTKSDWQRADAILEATAQATDVTRWAELNWEFHAVLYMAANRPRLLMMINALHTNIDRYVRRAMAKMDYLEHSQKEHSQLLDACRRRDTQAAVELLQQHIHVAGEQLVAYLQKTTEQRPDLRQFAKTVVERSP